jgi:hypothetical protein
MQTITTIGPDITKSVFRFTASIGQAMSSCVVSSSAAMCWRSSRSCRHAWSASRPVPRHSIGRARCRRAAEFTKLYNALLAREMKTAQI